VILEGAGASKGPCVMHAAGVTQRIIDDQEVLRETDDLGCTSQNSMRCLRRLDMHLTIDRVVLVLVEPGLPV
jgi:hypothetical protein